MASKEINIVLGITQETLETATSETLEYRNQALQFSEDAKVSEDNAKVSEDNADTSEANALSSANNASVSADNALVSENNAKSHENITLGYRNDTLSARDSASASASNASTSEFNAGVSEDNAKVSENNASSSESIALSSANSAETSWNDFQSRYYGTFMSDPTLDPLGNPPTNGDLYYNGTVSKTKIYTGSVWVVFGSAVNGVASNDERVATEGQTTFIGLSYDVGFVMVYQNGYKLPSSDFTATNGTELTLNTPASLGDEIVIVSFGAFTSEEFNNLTQTVGLNSTDIATLQVEMDTVEANIVTIENDIDTLQTDVNALENEVLRLDDAINTGTSSTETNTLSISTLESEMNTAQADIISNTDAIISNASAIGSKVNIDGTTEQDKVLLKDVTGNEPVYAKGNLYYAKGCLNVQTDYSDVTLQVGEEMHIVVYNNSGATIPNGMACKQNGAVGGHLGIELAIADTFINAEVLGFTTHDIPNNSEGLLSVFGMVRDVDTSAFTVGNPLYLSDTIAGTFTETAPIIKTQLGHTTFSDSVNGKIFADIISNIPAPRTLGSLLEATAPTSIPNDLVNGTPLELWTDSVELVTQVDKTLGTIEVSLDGTYRLNISLHMFFDNVGGAGKKEIYVDLIDTTSGTAVKSIRGFILKDAETYDITDNGAVQLLAGHAYRLEIRSELQLNNFAFSTSTYYIESILY